MQHNLDSLTEIERYHMLDFLLYHMSQEVRGKLMEAQPLPYVKVYPTAKQATLAKVERAMGFSVRTYDVSVYDAESNRILGGGTFRGESAFEAERKALEHAERTWPDRTYQIVITG